MILRIYNTMTKRIEEFVPTHGSRVNMFVCGPTVYDYSHLGHARTQIAYDIIARYLRFRGYSVFCIVNITDVNDKIASRAAQTKRTERDLARDFERFFLEDMRALGIESVNLYPRASDFIPEIIAQAEMLEEKGFAYETETALYYDTTKFAHYGELSGQKPEQLEKHRIEPDPTKKHTGDFCLWKKKEEKDSCELGWESPWGYGRPGWHIEDTAMTTTYFGSTYDIHGGAIELAFPHHEAEIAQAEAATGVTPLVRYWVHTGLLTVRGQKMSKSLGNFTTIKRVLKDHSGEVIRMYFASTHYRSPIDFREEHLLQAAQNLATLRNTVDRIRKLEPKHGLSDTEKVLYEALTDTRHRFLDAMDNDFNTPAALAAIIELEKKVNTFISTGAQIDESLQARTIEEFETMGGLLGILGKETAPRTESTVGGLMQLIIDLRHRFRSSKDWKTADEIREKLNHLGFLIEDDERGTTWRDA